jgi:hypothetical protein
MVLEKTEKEGRTMGKNARPTLSKISFVSPGVGRDRSEGPTNRISYRVEGEEG